MDSDIPLVVQKKSKFNIFTSIWIVPTIAIIIASSLVFQYYSSLGIKIKINFPKNEGLKAGQSLVKYKNVSIGVIEKISLNKEGEGVIVEVRMNKDLIDYLNDEAKFWIVKPEVGSGGVSGLDTIISGTYINMYSQKIDSIFGRIKKDFIGLPNAYRIKKEVSYFVLNSPNGYNISLNTPIYMKNIKVGKIAYINMSPDDKSIEYILYVKKDFSKYININSRFWVKNMLNMTLQNSTLSVNVAPIQTLVTGGIEFSSDISNPIPLKGDITFHLYKSKKVALNKKITKKSNSIYKFKLISLKSISRLNKDASIKYMGYDIGNILYMNTKYDQKTHKIVGYIDIEIDTSIFSNYNNNGKDNFYLALNDGLSAQISESDPISKSLFIDLIFDKNQTKVTIKDNFIPMIEENSISFNDLMNKTDSILTTIDNLKLDKLVNSLNKMIEDSNNVINNLNSPIDKLDNIAKDIREFTNTKSFKSMPKDIKKTITQLTRTLKTTNYVIKGYDSKALIAQQLSQMFKTMDKTAQEMTQFLEMLNRKPNSLIFGDH